jgi:membrane-bound ClpP family serine protease
MRILLVLVGLVLVLVGLFVVALGILTWVAFLGGIVLVGIGLMVDSKAKAASKARMRTKNRTY